MQEREGGQEVGVGSSKISATSHACAKDSETRHREHAKLLTVSSSKRPRSRGYAVIAHYLLYYSVRSSLNLTSLKLKLKSEAHGCGRREAHRPPIERA